MRQEGRGRRLDAKGSRVCGSVSAKLQEGAIHRDQERRSGCQGLGTDRSGERLLDGTAFPFRGMKTFQNLIEEVAAHGVNVTGILQ